MIQSATALARPDQRAIGRALPNWGSAKRYRLVDDEGGELWCFSPAEGPRCKRLLRLAEQGLFAFVAGGFDEQGPWLVRRVPTLRLSDLRLRKGRVWPWRKGLGLALGVARSLRACERAHLFPGPLTAESIAVAETDDARAAPPVFLPADGLLRAMVGAEPTVDEVGAEPKALLWLPPEKIDQQSWDNAANRYALGVLLYLLLSGDHPFGGVGLRHALREAEQDGVAPLPPTIAAKLPEHLQRLCLQLMAREAAERPHDSDSIVRSMQRIVHASELGPPLTHKSAEKAPAEPQRDISEQRPQRAKPKARQPAGSPSSKPLGDDRAARARVSRNTSGEPRSERPPAGELRPSSTTRRRGRVLQFVALLASAGVVVWAASQRTTSAQAPMPKPKLKRLRASGTSPQACAACHPEHVAQWSQSVMGHAATSPLFNALEALIEEQVGRSDSCPGGAGILRRAPAGELACRHPVSGHTITGSGGEHWCVNCHAPAENLQRSMVAWQGKPGGDRATRRPLRDLLGAQALQGISCAFCHQTHGPAIPGSRGYQGNESWRSFLSGRIFSARPEDRQGNFGISNSGYQLAPSQLLLSPGSAWPKSRNGLPMVHAAPDKAASDYLRKSSFCGSCHDVRLFGTDVLGARAGEHFKRLRNAYTEWTRWSAAQEAAGRPSASCQDCHMSAFPGVCRDGAPKGNDQRDANCPKGMHFESRRPGRLSESKLHPGIASGHALAPHYFTSVDLPLALSPRDPRLNLPGVDAAGIVLSARKRRNLLLQSGLALRLGPLTSRGNAVEIPIEIENVGAGHRVPAGFSQERELWLHLRVEDADGRLVYEVGRVDSSDEDLRDKIFTRVNTDPASVDAAGAPVGLFGADVRSGPDQPQWQPDPARGERRFRGRGLINFQNGFQRCVRCLGEIGPNGRCLALPFERHRAQRFGDGEYDIDTGRCTSNLRGPEALFEVYFPVGSLDARRGEFKGPDAIIDTRSLAPRKPVGYRYSLSARGHRRPLQVKARLLFRALPPFLVRAFARYEEAQTAAGLRPSGPLVRFEMLKHLEVVELFTRSGTLP